MSWDRSRAIPWSKLSQTPGLDLDAHKEQVFREMAQQEMLQANSEQQAVEGAEDSQDNTGVPQGIPFSGMEMAKQAAFGGCIGTITGSVFGFMDSMRTAGESQVLQKASNMSKGKYIMQGTTRSAALFGAFFGGFHVLKYGVRVASNPGDFTEIAVAAPITLGAMFTQPAMRPAMPYATMLIFMDAINIFMRNMDD